MPPVKLISDKIRQRTLQKRLAEFSEQIRRHKPNLCAQNNVGSIWGKRYRKLRQLPAGLRRRLLRSPRWFACDTPDISERFPASRAQSHWRSIHSNTTRNEKHNRRFSSLNLSPLQLFESVSMHEAFRAQSGDENGKQEAYRGAGISIT